MVYGQDRQEWDRFGVKHKFMFLKHTARPHGWTRHPSLPSETAHLSSPLGLPNCYAQKCPLHHLHCHPCETMRNTWLTNSAVDIWYDLNSSHSCFRVCVCACVCIDSCIYSSVEEYYPFFKKHFWIPGIPSYCFIIPHIRSSWSITFPLL